MTASADFLAYVLDQLAGLDGASSRRMFGGAGLYCDEFFFGLIADDVLYLRADDSNRADYTTRGMAQFRPYADRPQLSMNYYEIPADVLEDPAELLTWARRSVAAGRAAATKSRKKPTRRRVKPRKR
jgi:DNA transformation protein and related proteins